MIVHGRFSDGKMQDYHLVLSRHMKLQVDSFYHSGRLAVLSCYIEGRATTITSRAVLLLRITLESHFQSH